MAKANQAYHKRDVYNEVTARIHPHNAATSPPVISPAKVMTLAEYFAKQAVIAQWKAEGKRQTDIEVSELHQEARRYLRLHRSELWAKATERYRSFVESGRLKPPRNRRKPSQ
jgi:hypothetical protein